ncbi:MAG: N-acetylmuramoyl-L-alanine amidase [Dehalococcoidia bacterium]
MSIKICIDPGHGGPDPGAVGPTGVREKDIVLAVSLKLANILRSAGAEVKLTREDDSEPSLAGRVDISNNFDADVFISIHANAFSSPLAKGTEVWTVVGQTAADPIAESIANALQAAFPDLVFRADMSDGDQDKEAQFFVLKYTDAPAVLVELAFISNPDEERLLQDPGYQDKAIRAIAKGLGFEQATEQQPVGTPIVGQPTATLEQAQAWATGRGATAEFVKLAALYWENAPAMNIRADVAYAQSAKETGFGHFGGVIDASYHNFCGLKTEQGGGNNDPNAHMRFPDDHTGVLAHLQHLAAYSGLVEISGAYLVDPRYKWVKKGSAPTVEQLGGKWAPNTDYGTSIVRDYLNKMLAPVAPVPTMFTENWKIKLVEDAKKAGLIAEDHDPDAPATKWFVLRIALALLKLIKKQ